MIWRVSVGDAVLPPPGIENKHRTVAEIDMGPGMIYIVVELSPSRTVDQRHTQTEFVAENLQQERLMETNAPALIDKLAQIEALTLVHSLEIVMPLVKLVVCHVQWGQPLFGVCGQSLGLLPGW